MTVLNVIIFGAIGGLLFLLGRLIFRKLMLTERQKNIQEIGKAIEERLEGDFPGVRLISVGNGLELLCPLKNGGEARLGLIAVRKNLSAHAKWFIIDTSANKYGKMLEKIVAR